MKFITVFLILFFSPLHASSDDYIVSPFASEIGRQSVGDFLFRYIVFSTKGCMRVELLDLKNTDKEIITQENICGYKGKSFYTDVADASFEDIKITKDSLDFNLHIIGLRTTIEYDHKCTIKINGDEDSLMLSAMVCEDPVEKIYNE